MYCQSCLVDFVFRDFPTLSHTGLWRQASEGTYDANSAVAYESPRPGPLVVQLGEQAGSAGTHGQIISIVLFTTTLS